MLCWLLRPNVLLMMLELQSQLQVILQDKKLVRPTLQWTNRTSFFVLWQMKESWKHRVSFFIFFNEFDNNSQRSILICKNDLDFVHTWKVISCHFMFLVECFMFYLPLAEDSYVRNSWNGIPFLSVKYTFS